MILVFGSLNVDLSFALPHLPAAGETVLAPGYVPGPGGKGLNQAVAAARAGAATAMHGRLGDDSFGAMLRRTLAEEGIAADGVLAGDLPTGCAAIAVAADGANLILVGSGANREARADQVPDAALGPGTTVVLQLEVPVAETLALAVRARARGARVILNAAPAATLPANALAAVDIVIVNEIEAAMLTGEVDMARAGRRLSAAPGATAIVTRGGEGALAFVGGRCWQVGVLPIRPVDTVGAGDAFVGVLAARLDAGDDLPRALHAASVGGGLACMAAGAVAAMPTAAAIAANLGRLAPPIEV
ncbi:ribokinase [Stella humosa]|uniref:Ribokinase n=1 Tax=Stella humosa TaxID=94 RepID=A0A3N1KV86_9PROT|nr:PfkB family carbohydrate kinase [Stella humosa]ROP83392.1 ribokinase [Stella humosa]BBK29824.1 ribokinase [Stella humosa]